MKFHGTRSTILAPLLLLGTLPLGVLGGDILQTNGFSTCQANSDIQVNKLNISFNRATKKIDFDVAGTSEKAQNVTASMTVTAYGKQVYQKDFNPCSSDNFVAQLCPGNNHPVSSSNSSTVR